MKDIILDASLEVNPIKTDRLNSYGITGVDSKEFNSLSHVDTEIPHQNYLDYLGICWSNHYGIVISPTILWNLVLSNLAFEVNKNPTSYRKYFTESDEKQEIVTTQGGNLISVDDLISLIESKIPNNLMGDFFPTFTTDTESSDIANKTAFLDMVSPYYDYGMFLCGIPKVRVLGEKSDWLSFIFQLGKITTTIPEFSDYLIKVLDIISKISDETINYSEIFSLERCGSGHQVVVSGWISDLFMEQPRPAYVGNFITCVSKIDYKCYNDNKNYRLCSGLFFSKIDDGFLIPEFDKIYFEKL